ncbi:MAG: MOSC domain-containing protein [Burkholderiaceae bacterium]
MTAAPASCDGRIVEMWRYPVSSMAGERLASARVDATGMPGDRGWGVFNAASGEIADPSKSKWCEAMPQAWSRIGDSGAIEVSTDNENWGDPTQAQCQQELNELLGFDAVLRRYAAPDADGPQPSYKRSAIHLLTTAALRALQSALPGSVLDARRFRPNLLVDFPENAAGIPEYGWIGKEIHIGGAVLRGVRPCGRCAFTTLQQHGLPHDMNVLRTLALRFERHFGIYCEVLQSGEIVAGDAVSIVDSGSAESIAPSAGLVS